ncbi:hypothetical protein TSACC_2854 [Terrimicrobium sacchariphilum]|uniref:Uncharacterized protein n=1 Tax=Terrimicrobium sacchariphilum TaxID=690879 RepID=A0A146G3R5_TERSA|nr:hypothetical protein [Terrimicrobium sacchariphilum]GAT32455.1 hypothetical protein TSACC_2854 [Terrimicrobium sacchariphilum]
MKTASEAFALSRRAMVFLLVAGCSVYLGFLASVQFQLVSGSGSSPYPLDVSISVMLWAAFLVMTDITLRWFRFLRSGRFPRASRLWRRVLTCLLAVSGFAVLVCLFLSNP